MMIMLDAFDVVAEDLAYVVPFVVQREFLLSWASMKRLAACMMAIRLVCLLLVVLSALRKKLRLTPSRKDKNL